MAAPAACLFGCAGPRLSEDERAFFRDADPWGFILFARNVEDPGQLRRLAADLREAVGRDAPVLIDQEGGRVARMGAPHWRTWLPPLDHVAATGPHAARALYLRYRIIADELRAVGIDTNCVPCADLATETTHPILRNRCLGSDPAEVTANARAVATGLMAGGILPVLKHMPGHGRATVDSHLDVPVVDAAPEDLFARDFAVFRGLADLPLGMTAHVAFTAFDERPATLSPRMIRLVREEIGFGGFLMTDDISMGALGGTMATRSAAAIAAGCDAILHCNGDRTEMAEVRAAAGTLSAEALARGDRALLGRRDPQPVDISALEAELDGLLDGRSDDGD